MVFGGGLAVVGLAGLAVARRVQGWLSGPWRQPELLAREERRTGYRARPEDDERPAVDDLTFVLGEGNAPAFGALCGLVHRGIVEVRGERIVRGDDPLPPDASLLETELYPPESGRSIRDAMAAATERARPFHEARLRQWGLLVQPWVDQAARFCAACVALSPVVLALARAHASTARWATVAAVVLILWLARRVIRPGRVTARGRALAGEVHRRVLRLDFHHWPDASVDHETVVVTAAALGPYGVARTELRPVAAAALGFELAPGSAPRLGDAGGLPVDELLRRLSPTPTRELVALRRRCVAAIAVFAVLVCGGLVAAGTRVPSIATGRRGAAFLGAQLARREPVPPPTRGGGVMDCAGTPEERAARRKAKAKRNVFTMAAEIDRKRNPPEAIEPDFTTKRDHAAAPGSIHVVSDGRLYPIAVRPDGGVEVEPAIELEARLPEFETEYELGIQDRHSPAMRSITVDRFGTLYMYGDGRLYLCSPDTGVCLPRGILPVRTRSVFIQPRPDGQRFVAVDDDGRWGAVEVLNPTGFMADVMSKWVGKLELCVDPVSVWQRPRGTLSNPIRGFDGRLYATVFDPEANQTAIATLNPATGAVAERVGTLAHGQLDAAVLALPDRILVLSRAGSVWRYDPSGPGSTYVTHLGIEVHGVAAYFDPSIHPHEP